MFSRYFGRFLLLVGLLFFIFSLTIFAFLFLHPQGIWSPAVLPTHLNPGLAGGGSPCLQVGDLVIDKYWPNQIDLNSSDTIRVPLIRRNAGTFSIATSTTASHQATEETPTAYFGLNLTPLPNCGGTDLPSAFGTTNELFAAAHLVATTFTVQSTGPEEQSLNPANGTEWDWNISPKTLGTQLINVDIDLLWKSQHFYEA